ncbi:MAG: KH domain-containing protein [Bacillus sp. (in: Bacteria)]|nr:KH domain-containing protein [Bacillus sp. (in: firmicutes)]
MIELIETIVKPLVSFPDEVRVEAIEDDATITYRLSVHPEDVGKVIGKQGLVAKAIRTVVYTATGSKQQKKVRFEIVE